MLGELFEASQRYPFVDRLLTLFASRKPRMSNLSGFARVYPFSPPPTLALQSLDGIEDGRDQGGPILRNLDAHENRESVLVGDAAD